MIDLPDTDFRRKAELQQVYNCYKYNLPWTMITILSSTVHVYVLI